MPSSACYRPGGPIRLTAAIIVPARSPRNPGTRSGSSPPGHRPSFMASPLAQDQIDREATPDVRAGGAEVREEGGVGAAGLFQSVGQHAKACLVEVAGGEGSMLVGGECEPTDQADL